MVLSNPNQKPHWASTHTPGRAAGRRWAHRMSDAAVSRGLIPWLHQEDQLGCDQNVEDAAPLGIGAHHDLVEPQVDEVPDAMEEPAGRHQVAAQVRVNGQPGQGEPPNPTIASAWTLSMPGLRNCPSAALQTRTMSATVTKTMDGAITSTISKTMMAVIPTKRIGHEARRRCPQAR